MVGNEEENGPVKVLNQILGAQKSMARATVILYVVLALFGGTAWAVRSRDISYVNQIATTNQLALCAFRSDVQARVAASEQFLREHPNGIPGISPATIRTNLRAQRQTVDALSVLNCEDT
jgi:hypothetical protein